MLRTKNPSAGGTPICTASTRAAPGGQAYYDSIVKLYAAWGLDFIKADDMFGFGPNGDHSSEIDSLGIAIHKNGRPMVLSLSPGTRDASKAEFIGKHAQMWRISGDFWDRWIDLKNQFPRFNTWSPYVKPGNWPDADMLPLGHIGVRAERGDPRMSLLTHDEQHTLMTMWSIGRSPLMFGGHLPDNDDFTTSLLTNDEVLKVNQKATSSKQLFSHDNQIAWVAEIAGTPGKYLAVFNIGDEGNQAIEIKWADLGLPETCAARDLWTGKDLGAANAARTITLAPHASAFYRITAAKQ